MEMKQTMLNLLFKEWTIVVYLRQISLNTIKFLGRKGPIYVSALFIISTVIASCSSLKPLQSKKVEISKVSENAEFCNYYDSKSKVRYGFGNDDSVFYLRLEFVDEQAASSIAKSGLKVYFDGKNKKHKDVYLNFPTENTKGGDKPDFERPDFKQMPSNSQNSQEFDAEEATQEPPQMDVMQMIADNAIWSVYGQPYLFNWKLEKSPFKVNASLNESNQLIYEACIPISEIEVSEDSSFMFGVEFEKSSGNRPEMDSEMGMQGGPGGGMPPGGMSGGMSGGMGGGPDGGMGGSGEMGGPQTGDSSGSSQSSSFWVLVQLS